MGQQHDLPFCEMGNEDLKNGSGSIIEPNSTSSSTISAACPPEASRHKPRPEMNNKRRRRQRFNQKVCGAGIGSDPEASWVTHSDLESAVSFDSGYCKAS